MAGSKDEHFMLIRICRDVVRGKMTPECAAQQFADLQAKNEELGSVLLDVLQSLELEFTESDDATSKESFNSLCSLVSKHVIPSGVASVFLDTCADNTLGPKTIKLKTKLFFKQFKFNLFREESEGYAKLVSELAAEGECAVGGDVAGALNRITALTGQFNLDPNRVLDVILECLENGIHRTSFYVRLIRDFGAQKSDMCGLVGFRFSFYRDGQCPDSLYQLAAALLKEGLLEMLPLSHYLRPRQDDMCEASKRLVEDGIKRGKKAQNPAVATVSSDIPQLDLTGSTSTAAPTATMSVAAGSHADALFVDGTRELQAHMTTARNQKLGILWALLDIPDLNLALDIFNRLPEFYGVRCERVAQALCRIVGAMIAPLFQRKCLDYADIISSLSTATSSVAAGAETVTLSEEWRVDNWADVEKKLFPLLHLLGPHLATDPVVFGKCVRLLTAMVEERKKGTSGEDDSVMESAFEGLVNVCDEVFLPSLTALECNCWMGEEIWKILSEFPYALRYRLYGRWKSEHTKRHPILAIRRGQVNGRARYIMKRLSKETVKVIGRQVGKLAHTHPTIVFDYILGSIQTFENLIPPVVDSLKYGLNSMELDVLAFSLIEELANPEKEKLKVSDARLSPWLSSLATFAGTVFKRYAGMELTGILQYLANQLKATKSFDLMVRQSECKWLRSELEVLREMVESMSGTERTGGLTGEQLEACTGGEILRSEGGRFSDLRNTKRTTARLKEALMSEEGLILALTLLMAQQRAHIVHGYGPDQPRLHLKLTGQMLDECTETLQQFAGFLSSNLKPEDYRRLIPSLPQLRSQYHLSWPAAFLLSRPIYVSAIQSKFDEIKKENRKLGIDKAGSLDSKIIAYRKAVDSVIKPLAEEIRPLAPTNVWKELDPEMFVFFWLLTPYDVEVPVDAYDREVDKLRKASQAADDSKELSDSKRRKEKERLSVLESKLMEEKRKQTEHVQRVIAYLRHYSASLLKPPNDSSGNPMRAATMGRFLTLCILPRATLSDLDALFAARLVALLQQIRANFCYTLFIYDKLMDFSATVQALTENEASFYGRFLCCMLGEAKRWHADKSVFEAECLDTPGFRTKLAAPDNSSPPVGLEYENFRHLLHKWHWKLTRSSLNLLSSSSYVPIRNTMNVLIKMYPHFPVIAALHKNLEQKVSEVRETEKEKRQDLAVLATCYWGNLKMRGKDKLFQEYEFHLVKAKAAPKAEAKKTVTTTKPTSPEKVPAKAAMDALTQIKKTITTTSAETIKKVISTKKEPKKTDMESPKAGKDPAPRRVVSTTPAPAPNTTKEPAARKTSTDTAPPPTKKLKEEKTSQEARSATPDSGPRKRSSENAANGNSSPVPQGRSSSSSRKAVNGSEAVEAKRAKVEEEASPHRPPSRDPERRREHKEKRKKERSSRSHSKDPKDVQPPPASATVHASPKHRDVKEAKEEKSSSVPTEPVEGRAVIVGPSGGSTTTAAGRKVKLSKPKPAKEPTPSSSPKETRSSKSRK